MKPEKIHFGQVAYKFKISKGFIDRINASSTDSGIVVKANLKSNRLYESIS